jgi:hypothetical protein
VFDAALAAPVVTLLLAAAAVPCSVGSAWIYWLHAAAVIYMQPQRTAVATLSLAARRCLQPLICVVQCDYSVIASNASMYQGYQPLARQAAALGRAR